jgi:glycerate kinase
LAFVTSYFMTAMHILIAPNAFKNSLDASKVAEAIDHGLHQSKLSCTTSLFPVADGGDGTAELLIGHLKAGYVYKTVHDPLRREIKASFGWIEKNKTAIIELASASGLRLLKPIEYDPLKTTTFGTGELINEAINRNAVKIILCIGGSATVDGGVGILEALGIKFLDENKKVLTDLPASLLTLASIDLTGLDKKIEQTEIIILCDVQNSLLGINGAARVFGPQKGASEKDIQLLEAALTNFKNVVLDAMGKDMSLIKHGGAAGGVAASLNVLLNAKVVNGIDYFLEVTGFENKLKNTDMVITGEGSIDIQTLHGKGPFGVARKAKGFSLPVIGMAGKVPAATDRSLQQYFDQLISINDDNIDLNVAIRNTYSNLEKAARRFGNVLASSAKQS